jgi:hypothetical protein
MVGARATGWRAARSWTWLYAPFKATKRPTKPKYWNLFGRFSRPTSKLPEVIPPWVEDRQSERNGGHRITSPGYKRIRWAGGPASLPLEHRVHTRLCHSDHVDEVDRNSSNDRGALTVSTLCPFVMLLYPCFKLIIIWESGAVQWFKHLAHDPRNFIQMQQEKKHGAETVDHQKERCNNAHMDCASASYSYRG